MIRAPPRSTVTAPRLPYTPLFRSRRVRGGRDGARRGRHDGTAIGRRFAARKPGAAGNPGDAAGERRMGEKPYDPMSVGSHPSRGERSEEHTSELQSLMRISYAVFCLKKKNTYRKRYDDR